MELCKCIYLARAHNGYGRSLSLIIGITCIITLLSYISCITLESVNIRFIASFLLFLLLLLLLRYLLKFVHIYGESGSEGMLPVCRYMRIPTDIIQIVFCDFMEYCDCFCLRLVYLFSTYLYCNSI